MSEISSITSKETPPESPPPSFGRRLYSALLDPDIQGNLQKPIENFIAILIIVNVGVMLVEQIPAIYEPNKQWFHFFDTLSVIIFTIE